MSSISSPWLRKLGLGLYLTVKGFRASPLLTGEVERASATGGRFRDSVSARLGGARRIIQRASCGRSARARRWLGEGSARGHASAALRRGDTFALVITDLACGLSFGSQAITGDTDSSGTAIYTALSVRRPSRAG